MAAQGFFQEHWNDEDGNPAGGVSTGRGFAVSWQNGPLGKIDSPERREPNGAFVEDIIAVAIGRVEFYEDSKFSCEENRETIKHLKDALAVQESRTARRTDAKTEGTHEGK